MAQHHGACHSTWRVTGRVRTDAWIAHRFCIDSHPLRRTAPTRPEISSALGNPQIPLGNPHIPPDPSPPHLWPVCHTSCCGSALLPTTVVVQTFESGSMHAVCSVRPPPTAPSELVRLLIQALPLALARYAFDSIPPACRHACAPGSAAVASDTARLARNIGTSCQCLRHAHGIATKDRALSAVRLALSPTPPRCRVERGDFRTVRLSLLACSVR